MLWEEDVSGMLDGGSGTPLLIDVACSSLSAVAARGEGTGWGRGHKKSRSNCEMTRWEKARKGEGLLEIRESRVIHWFPKKLSLGGGVFVCVCVCLEIRGHCWVSFSVSLHFLF